MSTIIEKKLELIAIGCRDGLAMFAHRRGAMFEGFPRAACGPASDVLGRILKETLQLDGTYVCGEGHPDLAPKKSHAWFEVSDYLIDITHDQFSGTGLKGWVFSNDSSWHNKFDRRERPGYCSPEDWPMYPHEAYKIALAAANSKLYASGQEKC